MWGGKEGFVGGGGREEMGKTDEERVNSGERTGQVRGKCNLETRR
jgi:hypothetical protein